MPDHEHQIPSHEHGVPISVALLWPTWRDSSVRRSIDSVTHVTALMRGKAHTAPSTMSIERSGSPRMSAR